MSSKGNYGQKKKREAVRRLSQQGRSPLAVRGRVASGLHHSRRQKSINQRHGGEDEPDTLRRTARKGASEHHTSPLKNSNLDKKILKPVAEGGVFGISKGDSSGRTASIGHSQHNVSESSPFSSEGRTGGSFGSGRMRIGQLRSGRKPEPDHFSDQAGTRKSSFTITVDDAGTGYDEEEQGVSEQSRRIFMTESPNKQFQSHSKRGVKRDLSPSKSSEISRQLIPFDDPFSSDISDLETFGQAPVKMKDPQVEHEAKQGRSVVKRGSLFSRALEDAQGATGLEMKRRRPDESQTSDTSSKIQSALSTFASSKEVKSLNTIVCKGVPEELNNRIFLARFFKKFGDVRKVTVSPIKTMATIYFQNHDSAARAKKEVKELKPGTSPVTIFWGQKEKRTDSRTSAKDENVPHPAQQKVVPAGEQKREHSPAPNSTGRSVKTFHSAAERYEALEERDKQLRKGLTKQSDLATAKTMIGTCPDMCPEKERYMREVQRRLSPYEMVPGTEKQGENPRVDHIRAVKEYSRSSADQVSVLITSPLRTQRF
ncbi:uncharacterized protein [Diadema antillarum]|uniref:uncharacterized protein n=1 Tax=Diadema antillarum TaxID=105358 RepID=UPI003A88B79D